MTTFCLNNNSFEECTFYLCNGTHWIRWVYYSFISDKLATAEGWEEGKSSRNTFKLNVDEADMRIRKRILQFYIIFCSTDLIRMLKLLPRSLALCLQEATQEGRSQTFLFRIFLVRFFSYFTDPLKKLKAVCRGHYCLKRDVNNMEMLCRKIMCTFFCSLCDDSPSVDAPRFLVVKDLDVEILANIFFCYR